MNEPKEKFEQRYQECRILIEFIRWEVERLKSEAGDSPDWSQAEYLLYQRQQLKNMLISLMGLNSEEDSSNAIEKAITNYMKGKQRWI